MLITKSMWGSFSQSGQALDVGLAYAATLARVGVADVQHVTAGAAVAVVGVEHERRRAAAARLDRPVARGAGDGGLDQLGGDTHARAVDLGAGLREDLDGRRVPHLDARVGEHLQGRFVYALAGVVVPDLQTSFVHTAPPSLLWDCTPFDVPRSRLARRRADRGRSPACALAGTW